MAQQVNIKDWLNNFLGRRGLKKPDGRHLFSYRATPEEFRALEECLRQNTALASKWGFQNPFDLWKNVPDFDAVFVLYASLCWQQRYNGATWTYDVILEALNINLNNPSQQLRDIIDSGLGFWKLGMNSQGYTYLGAIAREAGLPQKLLSEDRGAVGRILHTVLKEALRSGQSGSIITSWIENSKNVLPQSYRNNKEIIELLADSINAILDIRQHLRAGTLEEAMTGLDETDPDWRSRFPLPLYDEAARELLTSLLEDAASSTQSVPSGSLISARRCLVGTTGQGWELLARLDIPSKIETGLGQDNPRVLSMRIASDQKAFDTVLKKHAESDFYFFNKSEAWFFSGQEAAQEIRICYTAPSGFCQTQACSGGMELDPELPWIFEGEQYEYRFRQQGGGSVRGAIAYVALAPGWEAEEAEEAGALLGTDRYVYRMQKSGCLKKGDLVFKVRTSILAGEEYDWSRDNRFWDVEVIQPSLVFRGIPKPVAFTDSTKKTPHGELLVKTPGMAQFSKLSTADASVGIMQVWFKAPDGASLRSRGLLLPESASVSLSTDGAGHGLLCLEEWQASSAAFAQPQKGLELECRSLGSRLELVFKILPEHLPPATVDILVYWRNSHRPAQIRVPFPQTGARLFKADGQEILPEGQLCASLLHGLRLYCFSTGVHHAALCLSLPGGKSLEYPLECQRNVTVIRLLDWKDALLEMLAMTSGLDACVSLDVLFDGQKIAGWKVARYEARLIPDGTKAVLSLPEHGERPWQGYAMKALLLDHPEAGTTPLNEAIDEGGTAAGEWELSEVLDRPGPWLVFDDTEGTSLRPLLWLTEGDADGNPRNALQSAIAENDWESRQNSFSACIQIMEQRLDTEEWTTLLALLNQMKNLPLSTLEAWQAFLRSPRIMAMIALHPDISFLEVISRISTELPFLWNVVSREDWSSASESVKRFFERLIPSDTNMAAGFWQEHMQKRKAELGSCCPSVNALLHIALSLPSDKEILECVRAYYTAGQTANLLFNGDNSEMQKLLRRHADDEWPEAFTKEVNRGRLSNNAKPFLPFSQGLRNSVLGLPVLLTLQAFASQQNFSVTLDQNTIFHIREHLYFDPEWFEQASTLTAYCCAAEHFMQ